MSQDSQSKNLKKTERKYQQFDNNKQERVNTKEHGKDMETKMN